MYFLLNVAPEEYEDAYDDAYEEDDYKDDVFTMEVGDDGEREGEEEDPDFYPDDLLHQGPITETCLSDCLTQ